MKAIVNTAAGQLTWQELPTPRPGPGQVRVRTAVCVRVMSRLRVERSPAAHRRASGGRTDFPWNRLLHRELELIGSNASAGAWDEAVALAAGGRIPLGRLVSHRVPASDYARGIELARNDRSALKVVLDWRGGNWQDRESDQTDASR